MNPVLPLIAVLVTITTMRAAEPFLKPNDVIALVGGEDMVAASEYGYLELLLQRALPDYKLKVRSLAWEGDTVFEQPRDLNYPALEAQLEEIGATVVVMQFGQMESLAGTSKLPEFIKAYEKLIERVGKNRRVMLAMPAPVKTNADHERDRARYAAAIRTIAGEPIPGLAAPSTPPRARTIEAINLYQDVRRVQRDGLHADDLGHREFAYLVGHAVDAQVEELYRLLGTGLERKDNVELHQALSAIRAKNRLWFHYYRPQNWAFLNGDRTEQPSSRDHKDPSKRWFPEEMKQWLPLIDAKEKEIWALAAKAAGK